MEASVLPRRVYRFGLFQVDLDGGKLLRQGVPVKLQEQPLRVLCLLLERPGEIVSREELRQSLWPEGTHVEFDGSLNAALKRLRFAIGDDADNPIFIETVPRRGYRFIAPVEREQHSEIYESAIAPATVKSPAPETVNDRSSPVSRLPPRWMLAAMIILLLGLGWWYATRSRPSQPPARKVIAVLPFVNEGAGPDFDYLRYAIANDLVTDLTHTNSVSVRPFASTSRYASQPADPATVGAELRVTHVVAGGFLREDKSLRVHLELVDVAQNQAVWREEVTASPQDLVGLHNELAVRTAQGLLPAMHISNASAADVPVPRNERALELFLHSLSISYDPQPNLIGIKQLEESVSLDGDYAPAWAELSKRYSYDFHYGNGGNSAAEKMRTAYKRQAELDPNWPSISAAIRLEEGDPYGAYDQAADFLRRHKDLAEGHFYMSYDLLYAGLLDEAGNECEAARALDPGNVVLRACAVPFILQGDYPHAQPYIRLEEHSGFGAMLRMTIALRTGNRATALAESDVASQGGFRFAGLARVCLNHAPEAELRRAATELEVGPAWHDGEMYYFNAAVLSYCGQSDAALRQLRTAIKENYCSSPASDKDPLFDPIRQRPEFAELRHAAVQCQQNFLAHRRQVDAALTTK
jgi:DNA-binding winged helix-turn-helix (wHTH) protein/TolB-like protein